MGKPLVSYSASGYIAMRIMIITRARIEHILRAHTCSWSWTYIAANVHNNIGMCLAKIKL